MDYDEAKGVHLLSVRHYKIKMRLLWVKVSELLTLRSLATLNGNRGF